MKKILIAISAAVVLTSSAFASEAPDSIASQSMISNNVESHMSNIRDRVRQCSILPYTVKNGVKVYHHLLSHCPEVKVLEKGRAKIRVGGATYYAQLVETRDTDGDFYNVVIRDYISNDEFVLQNVLAYGDVMLGILDGVTKKIPEVYVANQGYLGQFE